MRVAKTKPKYALWLITTDADNPVNQSELEANAAAGAKRGKTRASKVMIGFGFTSDWSRKWREIF